MTDQALWLTLASAAIAVGSLHSLAPDHWLPFAAVARAQGWSAARTAGVTLVCGLGHVTVSVLLGMLALVLGLELVQAVGDRLQAAAGVLLIGFGAVYGLWGLRRAAGERLHGHAHRHYDHVHDPSRTTARTLFLLFSADPCAAVIPILFASAPLGAARTVAIVILYEAATLLTMVALVLPVRAGAARLRLRWLDRYGDAAAGGLIAGVGAAVALLGW